MRRFLLSLAIAGFAQTAQAADMPDLTDLPPLRGAFREPLSATGSIWQGAYVGGQVGYTYSNIEFLGASAALANLSANTAGLRSPTTVTTAFDKTTNVTYGGFAGYNWQWDDAVLGIDANYNLGGQSARAIITPAATRGFQSFELTDFGSLRMRAAWSVGSFLPYGTVGLAIGRADVLRSITNNNGQPGGPIAASQAKDGQFLYGYSYGGGVDVYVMSNVFLRAEIESLRFTSMWGVSSTVTTGRIGAGYKF